MFVATGAFGVEIAPIQCSTTASVEDLAVSSTLRVEGFPNPFVDEASIRLRLPETSDVVIEVHDVQGRRIHSYDAGKLAPLMHEITWNGEDESGKATAPGIYFVRVRTNAAILTGHLIRTSRD